MGVSPTVGKNLNGYPRGERVEKLSDSRKTRAGVSLKWSGHDPEEGNPIQYSFMPNHNVKRLKEIIDARRKSRIHIYTEGILTSHSSWKRSGTTVVAAAGAEGNEDEVLFLRDLQALFNEYHGITGWTRWDAPKNERSLAIRFLMHFMNL